MIGSVISAVAGDSALRFSMGTIKIDKEKCTKCGKCVDNCAWNAISINPENKFPKRNKNICGGCLTCINICPEGALWTVNTKGKVRYVESSYLGRQKRYLD